MKSPPLNHRRTFFCNKVVTFLLLFFVAFENKLCYNKEKGCDFMLKKATSLLSKLNFFCVILFLICFIIVRLDIMPDNFFTMCLWTGYVSFGITLLFIISAIVLTIKEKKRQDSFGFVVTYFIDTIFIGIVGYLVYALITTPIF